MGFDFQTKISSLLSRVNKLLNKTFSEEHFVTLVYCELTDDRNGLVLYANCGHNNPILFRANGTVEMFEATGQILGPFPKETFRTENTLMKKGDILFSARNASSILCEAPARYQRRKFLFLSSTKYRNLTHWEHNRMIKQLSLLNVMDNFCWKEK
jgi:hypothetical protein